jgi:hypothetical protein
MLMLMLMLMLILMLMLMLMGDVSFMGPPSWLFWDETREGRRRYDIVSGISCTHIHLSGSFSRLLQCVRARRLTIIIIIIILLLHFLRLTLGKNGGGEHKLEASFPTEDSLLQCVYLMVKCVPDTGPTLLAESWPGPSRDLGEREGGGVRVDDDKTRPGVWGSEGERVRALWHHVGGISN